MRERPVVNAFAGHRVIDHHDDDADEPHRRADEPADESADAIEPDSSERAPELLPHVPGRRARSEQFRVSAQVAERRQPGGRHDGRRDGVEDDRHSLVVVGAGGEGAGQHGRREGEDHRAEQKAQIQPVEGQAEVAYPPEQRVVVEPEDPT
jgi:hypothetical protein